MVNSSYLKASSKFTAESKSKGFKNNNIIGKRKSPYSQQICPKPSDDVAQIQVAGDRLIGDKLN